MPCARGLIVALLFLLLAGPAAAQSDKPVSTGRPVKSTTGAMLRSLVVPGWGQAYNGVWWKAGIFAAIETIQIVTISQAHDLMMAARTFDAMPEQYLPADTSGYYTALAANNKQAKEERDAREVRNKTIWWFAGTVLLSMGDAYVDAHLYGLDFSPDISLINDTRVGVTATVRF